MGIHEQILYDHLQFKRVQIQHLAILEDFTLSKGHQLICSLQKRGGTHRRTSHARNSRKSTRSWFTWVSSVPSYTRFPWVTLKSYETPRESPSRLLNQPCETPICLLSPLAFSALSLAGDASKKHRLFPMKWKGRSHCGQACGGRRYLFRWLPSALLCGPWDPETLLDLGNPGDL